ncbi:hypothetical protein SAMN04487904_101612 [Actinopolyspora lacussalsi subsp. righensis]|uniref:DUF4878 domain-containing protein n=1 Tax=Actinopolyspora righensis TaxID=995060 RepID=A0A1I6XIM7_9ACTN|nr:hypothetical protein [Actinopolyspora righensis]SFT37754.1 hypothetical protein SAMN04487904_101612 [Actinopolyspora righensis]
MTQPPRRSGPGGEARRPENGTGHHRADPWHDPSASWQHSTPGEPPVGQPLPPGRRGPPPSERHVPGTPPPPPDWGDPAFNRGLPRSESRESFEAAPPTEHRSRRRWVLPALLGALLAGAATGGYFLFFTGPDDPRPAATNLLDRINDGRFESLEPELCSANRARLLRQLEQLSAGEFDLKLGEISARGESATVRVTGTYSAGSASYRVDQPLGLRWEDGRWRLCDLAR